MAFDPLTDEFWDPDSKDPKQARGEMVDNIAALNAWRASLLASSLFSGAAVADIGSGLELSSGLVRLKTGNTVIRVSDAPEVNMPTRSIVAGDTIIATDRGKLLLCNGTFTLAITAAATLANGFECAVRNIGAGTITINPNGSEQIDGATTITLASGESCIIGCNGTAFYTIGRVSLTQIATAQFVAKAWLTYEQVGTATLLDSYNVASVTDVGTGTFTPAWDTDFANVNYAPAGMAADEHIVHIQSTINKLVGSCRFTVRDAQANDLDLVDSSNITIVVFGD